MKEIRGTDALIGIFNRTQNHQFTLHNCTYETTNYYTASGEWRYWKIKIIADIDESVDITVGEEAYAIFEPTEDNCCMAVNTMIFDSIERLENGQYELIAVKTVWE